MAAIPEGIAIWWPGTAGSIPDGWDRNTDFDDKFPKGTAAGTDPGTQTGGGATHVHGSDNHSHTLASHTHDYQTQNNTNEGSGGGGGASLPLTAHYHTGTSGAASGGSSGTTNSTWGAQTSLPNNHTGIYIESDGTPEGFPDDCLLYYNSGSAPAGWTNHAASRELFMVGAGSGANGGGGTTPASHAHSPDGSHTHTADTSKHTHGNSESGASSGGDTQVASTSAADNLPAKDTHTIGMEEGDAGTATATANTGGNTASYTNLPPYHILLGIQNTSGADSWLEDAIVMWIGTLSAAAALDDWQLCDGSGSTPDLRGRFIKMASSGGGDVGNPAGATGHDHTDPSGHTHPTSGTHEGGFLNTGHSGFGSALGTGGIGAGGHSHYIGGSGVSSHFASTEAVSPGYASAVQPVDTTSDTQPPFKCVAYLQAPEEPEALGSAAMFGASF